ncbi:O-acetyl-ADP-ribose deacetylase [Candidatus Bathyarchaeota archaeon]|nr:O-acetyl-ADP-ribose deacetylase [Candidatus Bathyarchaeota archaeon]
MSVTVGKVSISLFQGDITTAAVDVIVNAANSRLNLGGGVAGAILAKGGPRIQEECDQLGSTPVGTAVITTGGNLPSKYVIHAVGPRAGEGNEQEKLENATRGALEIAEKKRLKSIAFPAISTGIFGYPVQACARNMLSTVKRYATERKPSHLRDVRFYLFDGKTYSVFHEELQKHVNE